MCMRRNKCYCCDLDRGSSKLHCSVVGWMFGKLDGRVGIFPADYVEPMSRIEARKFSRVVSLFRSLNIPT